MTSSFLKVRYPDNPFIFVPPLLIVIILIVLNLFIPFEWLFIIGIACTLLFILMMMFHLYRLLQIDIEDERIQNQALISIHKLIQIRFPIPALGRWAINPELGSVILEYISILKPTVIVEAGSGSSTIISSYALEKQGFGKIYSLDHDSYYGKKTVSLLEKHELNKLASVSINDFITYDLKSASWKWYNLESLENVNSIQMLVIDGPPEKLQDLARYPAVPLLFSKLADKSVVILDDAYRKNELKIAQRWLKEFPGFELHYRGLKKGIAIFERGL